MATQQHSTTGAPRRSRFQAMVEIPADALGGSIGWMAEHGVLFAIFALIWLVMGAAILLNPSALDETWQQIGSLPLLLQLVVWLLFLPVMAGMWIWQTDWSELLRIVLILGLAAFTLLVMRPTKAAVETKG